MASDRVELGSGWTTGDLPQRWLGKVTVRATSRTPADVFVGIGPSDQVDAYLAGVAHTTLTGETDDQGDPETTFEPGGSPTVPPSQADFWVVSAQGPGRQTVTWEPDAGDWTVVVMNTDGSTPVRVRASVGAEVPVLGDVALWLLGSGLVVAAIAVTVILVAVPRTPRTTPPQDVGTQQGPR